MRPRWGSSGQWPVRHVVHHGGPPAVVADTQPSRPLRYPRPRAGSQDSARRSTGDRCAPLPWLVDLARGDRRSQATSSGALPAAVRVSSVEPPRVDRVAAVDRLPESPGQRRSSAFATSPAGRAWLGCRSAHGGAYQAGPDPPLGDRCVFVVHRSTLARQPTRYRGPRTGVALCLSYRLPLG